MIIRRGEIKDVQVIMNIIKAAIIDMELKGIDQWDSIYPNEEVIVNDINNGFDMMEAFSNALKGEPFIPDNV